MSSAFTFQPVLKGTKSVIPKRGRKKSFQPVNFLNPKMLALSALVKALAKHDSISKEARENWRGEMFKLEDITVMNMDLLASALVLLSHLDNKTLTPALFKKYKEEAMKPLEPGTNVKDKEELKLRLEADLLRYVRKIISFREENEF
jgi:hypothetical protein